MYRIRLENLDELKEGKTISYLANLIGYARPYLNNILTGNILVEEKTAKKILIPIFEESRSLYQKYELYGIDTMMKHFFKKIE